MAKYMTLAPVWLRAKGDAADRYYDRGAVIEYDGVANVCLAALDDEARAVKTKVGQLRSSGRARDDAARERHLRTTLNRSNAAALASTEMQIKGA
jgi:hypothetical protein